MAEFFNAQSPVKYFYCLKTGHKIIQYQHHILTHAKAKYRLPMRILLLSYTERFKPVSFKLYSRVIFYACFHIFF
jgi:hypothetical protein